MNLSDCSRMNGIIPADAGSTAADYQTATGNKDHPRGCGEHPDKGPELPITLGSSPRMRGARSRSRVAR